MSPRLLAYLVSAAVVLGLLGWAGFSFHHLRTEAARVPGLIAERDQARADAVKLRSDYTTAQRVSRDYQAELSGLRAAADAQPPRAVRLCIDPAPRHSPIPAAERGLAGGATAAGVVSDAARPDRGQGPDIGPELYRLAEHCDRVSAQLRGLQAFVVTVGGEVN